MKPRGPLRCGPPGTPYQASCATLLRLDVDAASTENRSGRRVVCSEHLVVVDDRIAIVLIPNLDAELVRPTSAVELAVDGGEHKPVIARAVDRAGALELSLRTRDDEPFVDFAVEVDVARLELELGVSIGRALALLVLRDEPEVGLSNGQRRTRGDL